MYYVVSIVFLRLLFATLLAVLAASDAPIPMGVEGALWLFDFVLGAVLAPLRMILCLRARTELGCACMGQRNIGVQCWMFCINWRRAQFRLILFVVPKR